MSYIQEFCHLTFSHFPKTKNMIEFMSFMILVVFFHYYEYGNSYLLELLAGCYSRLLAGCQQVV